MMDLASKALAHFADAVQLCAILLIGVVMTGAGVTLAMGGRPEAIVPLLLGAMALSQMPKRLKNLYRDLTGNY
ncbi:MAG: hypothetical protein RLO80_08585 [Hyphomonas sp.]